MQVEIPRDTTCRHTHIFRGNHEPYNFYFIYVLIDTVRWVLFSERKAHYVALAGPELSM